MANDVATKPTPSPLQAIESALNDGKARMAMLVPRAFQRTYDIQRQIMAFGIEASKNPELLACEHSSIRIAFYQAAALGLEIGSALGHGYLVPFKANAGTKEQPKWVTRAQFIPGFRGLIYAAIRSGAARQVWAETIHENDTFAVRLGTDPKIEHQPTIGDRGEAIGVYAVARLHGGGTQFVVLDKAEVERVRAASKSGKFGPWANWWEEMAKKTAIRRLVKQLSVSTDEQRATFLRATAIDAEIDAGAGPDQISATLGITGEKVTPDAPRSADVLDTALASVDDTSPEAMAAADRAIAQEQGA